MKNYILERLNKNSDSMRLLSQERTILEVTELMCQTMDREGVSRSELAEKLGTSKGHISQLLDGEANMTLRTISDIFHALGYRFKCDAVPQVESISHGAGGTMETVSVPLLSKICTQVTHKWADYEQDKEFGLELEYVPQALAG